MIETASFDAPMGTVQVAMRDERVVSLVFAEEEGLNQIRPPFPGEELRAQTVHLGVVERLRAYFDGDLDALDIVEVETGGTAFQRRVWSMLRSIPAGTTLSYAELATKIGAPTAMRAVGSACGANPVGIIVPCHRIVRTDGSLGGYAGGLDRKRALLEHEGVRSHARPQTYR